jgi:hypothetical protein
MDSDSKISDIHEKILELHASFGGLREFSVVRGEQTDRLYGLLQDEVSALRREQREIEGRIEWALHWRYAEHDPNLYATKSEVNDLKRQIFVWRTCLLGLAAILSAAIHGFMWILEPFYRICIDRWVHRSFGE